MTWLFRSPLSFPAHFARTIREAVLVPERPVLFGSYRSRGEASAVSDQFRYYRWCLREQPGVQPDIFEFESEFQLRLKCEHVADLSSRWAVLYLTATPDRVGALVARNPHLAALFASEP